MFRIFTRLGTYARRASKWVSRTWNKVPARGRGIAKWVVTTGAEVAIFAWAFDDSDDSTPEGVGQTNELAVKMILNPAVVALIHSEVTDPRAILSAYRVQGLRLLADDRTDCFINGTSLLAAAEYAENCASPASFLLSEDEIQDTLKQVADAIGSLYPFTDKEDQAAMAESIEAIVAIDWEDMDDFNRKNLDFLAYYFKRLNEDAGPDSDEQKSLM